MDLEGVGVANQKRRLRGQQCLKGHLHREHDVRIPIALELTSPPIPRDVLYADKQYRKQNIYIGPRANGIDTWGAVKPLPQGGCWRRLRDGWQL